MQILHNYMLKYSQWYASTIITSRKVSLQETLELKILIQSAEFLLMSVQVF